MTESSVDAERLAALLDGRLSARERAELLAEVASSDEAYDALVDAMLVLPEVSDETPPADRVSDTARARHAGTGWPLLPTRWLALAATLVVLVLLPWLWRARRSTTELDAARFVALLHASPAGLPDAWNSGPWTATRGASDPLTRATRAVRLGAHLVDLELAAREGDARAGPLAADIAALLDGVPAGAPAAAIYRSVSQRAAAPFDSLATLLERGRVATSALAGGDLVAVGAWVEAARIAAARHDARFFQDDASRDMLARAARLSGVQSAGRTMVDSIRGAATSSAPDWPRLERQLTALLAALAG
jgi:hypothetical protein